jgi:hypothetical protein
MPLENSIFRIIHRTSENPHGVEGYFIHELYMRQDGTVRGWRAGVSVGALSIHNLKEHMIRVIDAFNYEPINYIDLIKGMEIPLIWKLNKLEDASGDLSRALPENNQGMSGLPLEGP